ncbi:MAG: MBL fold metallo-hydrolase [Pseudomonadota bacterium]
MERRAFLASGAAMTFALGSGLTVSLRPVPAFGQADQGLMQLAAAQRFRVGDLVVTALSDGFLALEPSQLSGIDEAGYAALAMDAFQRPEAAQITAVNAYAIDDGASITLIDAGTGPIFGPTLGQMGSSLSLAGIDPASVTRLVATHMHPDHVGGALIDGTVIFPNAELVSTVADQAFWTNTDIRNSVPADIQGFFDLASGVYSAYGDQVRLLEGEAPIASGLTFLPLPGHTPGHAGVMVESAGESLLVWGDIIHAPTVQFTRPEVTIAFDSDQDMAATTRARLMDQVVTDRMMVAGMHLSFPGIGHVDRSGEAFRFVPAPWTYS